MMDGTAFNDLAGANAAHDDTEAVIARLAALDPLEYDRCRVKEADALGVRVGTLDERVKAARPQDETAVGRGVVLPEVDPWHEPVRGAEVLTDLAKAIRKHVILSNANADAIALWIAHTYVADRFQHTPRLGITSPTKRCGKSTLMDVLRCTVHRPLKADNISASGVFRTVEALSPLTLLLDEADSFLGENEELRGVLNSGFERSGVVIRQVEIKEEWTPIQFRTFAPLALAAIGELPGTLEDRAVPIVLQRKAAAEAVTKLRSAGARDYLQELSQKLRRWENDRGPHLPMDPSIPDALGDREGDISVPLLSIADDIGGEWPARARTALLQVFGLRTAAEGTMETGSLLLGDIKLIFAGMSAVQMGSADIVKRLTAMEERPWPEWRQGKPITPPQLARALRPFGIRPATIRFGEETAKGYYRDAFEEAWNRYLPVAAPEQAKSNRNTVTTQVNSGFAGNPKPSHDPKCDGYESGLNPRENLGCDGVTAQNPESPPKGMDQGWEASL